jgi:hypothetical protein
MEDSTACQNIELFEATGEEVAEHSLRDGAPVVARQVGIRCIHCVKMPTTAAQSTLFPGSLGAIAASVRQIADNHLIACQRVPPEVREFCDRAASKRVREQGGQGTNDNEDEKDRDQIALIGYCVDFCHRLGVVNKQPHKSGIVFSDGPDMSQYPPLHPSATTPVAPRGGVPTHGHPFSADQMGPPMSMERMPFQTPGLPTFIPRGESSSMMGGPVGTEGIAPTPLQSRRDRGGQGTERPPVYSAERDGPPAPPDYSVSFPPVSDSADAFGRPDGPGMQTPAQPNYEGREGASYPLSAQRPESSPQGYQDMPQYDLPANFPFYLETDRSWHCKFCSHIHPQYRDPQSIWSAPGGAPPPGQFIDEHLSICRAFYQSMSSPSMYQGPSGSYGAPMMGPQHMGLYGPPPGAWDSFQYPGQPPFPYPPNSDGRYPGAEDGFLDQRRAGGAPLGLPGAESHMSSGTIRLGASQQMQRKPDRSPESIQRCINHLVEKERDYYARDPELSKIPKLVLDEDKLLLTDYFFYLMKQLRLCRFTESDRKTRGGKREKIKLGYGGLQCIHCADVPNARKFFWSNVDRLANSFAEIPGHVLKCRRCPQHTKDALLSLKLFHPDQMSGLPRGSQKVFFRRMWRRLHDEDPDPTALTPAPSNEENITPEKVDPCSPVNKKGEKKETTGSPASVGKTNGYEGIATKRSTKEAAKALADSGTNPGQLPPLTKHLLAIPEDKEWLSDMDCFIRNQLEVFCATETDVSVAQSDRKFPVHVRQVGIRCIHCSLANGDTGVQGQAVAYPLAVNGIYESVRELKRLHLDSCENVPTSIKQKLQEFNGSASLSSVLRKYYILGAKALGLRNTRDGIQAGGEHVPINPQAAFSFSECPPRASAEEIYPPKKVAQDVTSVPSQGTVPDGGMVEENRSSPSMEEAPTASVSQQSIPDGVMAEEERPSSSIEDTPTASVSLYSAEKDSESTKKREASSLEESDDRPAKMTKTEPAEEEKSKDLPDSTKQQDE